MEMNIGPIIMEKRKRETCYSTGAGKLCRGIQGLGVKMGNRSNLS